MGSRVPPKNGGDKLGFRRPESQVTIRLTSRSKQEIREVKRKLVNELELVRRLVKKIEEVGSKPLHQFSGSDDVEIDKKLTKMTKMTKLNQFYRKSDVLSGSERHKKLKSGGKKEDNVDAKFSNKLFKSCRNLLEKLMKHKHGWVFNTPVDPLALGLHDYFDIIKHPMDLGTVKSRLDKNWYNSPMEFAEDVRLTFQNAIRYNPKGQDVHAMAELLLKLFEEKWKIIEADSVIESKLAVKNAPPRLLPVPNRVEPPVPAVDLKPQPTVGSNTGRTPSLKKAKAKDLNKREMTYDEKAKLSFSLQNLPPEKLENVVNIIKKRTPLLSQNDDEIEVDIETFDNETLWELDRFVAYNKKDVNKNKRKAEFADQETVDAESNVQDNAIVEPVMFDAPKASATDEKIASANSPIQLEKQLEDQVAQGDKPSSSSSISGSSSSDSDSDSSSEAGSDAANSSKA